MQYVIGITLVVVVVYTIQFNSESIIILDWRQAGAKLGGCRKCQTVTSKWGSQGGL